MSWSVTAVQIPALYSLPKVFSAPPHPNPLPPLGGEGIRGKNFWQTLYNLSPSLLFFTYPPRCPSIHLQAANCVKFHMIFPLRLRFACHRIVSGREKGRS